MGDPLYLDFVLVANNSEHFYFFLVVLKKKMKKVVEVRNSKVEKRKSPESNSTAKEKNQSLRKKLAKEEQTTNKDFWMYATGPVIERFPLYLQSSQHKLLVDAGLTKESETALNTWIQNQIAKTKDDLPTEDHDFFVQSVYDHEDLRHQNRIGSYHANIWERSGEMLEEGFVLLKGMKNNQQFNVSETELQSMIGKEFHSSYMCSTTAHPNVVFEFVTKSKVKTNVVPSKESVICVYKVTSSNVRAKYVSHLIWDYLLQMEQEILLAPNHKVKLTSVETRTLTYTPLGRPGRKSPFTGKWTVLFFDLY